MTSQESKVGQIVLRHAIIYANAADLHVNFVCITFMDIIILVVFPGNIRMEGDKETEIKSARHIVLGTIFIFICNLIYLGELVLYYMH